MEEENVLQETEPDVGELSVRLAAAENENRLYRLAPGLGVSPAAVPYLARLCPDAGADDDAVRATVEKLLADLPGLREAPAPAPKAGFRIGAAPVPAESDDELLRAAFGIR